MKRTTSTTLACVFAVLQFAGCAADAGDDGSTRSLGPRLTAEPDLRLGSVDDPDQNFTRLESVVIGPAGEIIVADAQANMVRIYGEDGRPLRTVGAPGSGPGHFESLQRVALRGDTLLAFDGQPFVSAFTLDGTYQRSVWRPGERWMFAREGPTGLRFMYLPTAPEALIGDTSAITMPNVGYSPGPLDCTPGVADFVLPRPYFRVGTNGSIADTLLWSEDTNRTLTLTNGGATYRWRVPFMRKNFFGMLPEGQGILIADETPADEAGIAAIHLTALSPRRDTLWRRELPVSPIPSAPEHVVAAALRTPPIFVEACSGDASATAAMPTPEQIATAYRDSDGALPDLPALTGLHVGQDGSIWLRREESAPDSTAWQRLDPNGEPLGFLRLPVGQRVIAANGDVFLTTETDELDVPYLVRYRLAD